MRTSALLLILVAGCGLPAPTPTPKTATGTGQAPVTTPTTNVEPQAAIHEFGFGEPVAFGDARVTIVEAYDATCVGQYRGQFASQKFALVRISVQNISAGKIVDWAGWQAVARLTDEHGNGFAPALLRGWSWLPNNYPDEGLDGDTGTRIHPGKTYTNLLYFESVPDTSKRATVLVSFNGSTIRFGGLFGRKATLENAKHLEKVKGKILSASDAAKAVVNDRATGLAAFPIGCTLRAEGRVVTKNIRAGYIDLEFNGAHVICNSKSKSLFDGTVVGRTVRVKGIFTFLPPIKNDRPQIQMGDCILDE